MELFYFSMIDIAILSALGILLLIQLLYLVILYTQIHKRHNRIEKEKVIFSEELPPLSVVICAKNETESLQKNLSAILEQNYPRYEVIVVNDSLSDDSEDLLKIMENKYAHLYHTFTPDSSRYISRKKLAVTIGIKASKYDWLVFTEANCTPASKNWLRLMARNFTEETGIVLGYSKYEPSKGWLSLKSSFDNLFSSMRYLGCALLKKPYMGRGRNMAYKKEYFFQNKGFSSHLNLQRGEDDLFINKIASSSNTRVETDKDAVMKINPLQYSKQWSEEKLNEEITSKHLTGSQQYWLGLETFTRILFYLVFFASIPASVMTKQWVVLGISVTVFLARYIVQLIVFNRVSSDLEERKYFFLLPFFDLFLPLAKLKYKLKIVFSRRNDFMR